MHQFNRQPLSENRAVAHAVAHDHAARVAYFLEKTASLRGQIETHRRLSPDQEAMLDGLATDLGIAPPLDANYRLFRELWAAENGGQVYLDMWDTSHPRLSHEQCCFMEPAVWRQPEGYSGNANSSHFSTPFPLTKCASYRIGNLEPRPRPTEGTREMAKGTLYITDFKLFFDSETRCTSVTFNGIHNVECYSNGIEVGKSNGRPEFFQMTALASQYAYMIIHELNRLT